MYGYCPHCGEQCNYRERSPNGNTRCIKGHSFPHHQTLSKRPVYSQLMPLSAIQTVPPDEDLESLLAGDALDEAVRENKLNEAMGINNEGVRAQLAYLKMYLSADSFACLIHELID